MKIVYYQDKRGEWRWRARAKNGRIVAESGEGYKRRSRAEHGCAIALSVLAVCVPGRDYPLRTKP
jgi:uncharacterized protein YegP (UPF0339 family)